MKFCKICGRKLDIGDDLKRELCQKHKYQMKRFGFTIEDNSRNENDLNEIKLYPHHAEIILYDEFQEELEERALIDLDDIDLVKDIRWNKRRECVTGNFQGKEIPLQNYILNTNEKIIFVSKDSFDCRRNNLYLAKNTKKKHKIYNISKKNKGKIIIEFVGKSKTQVTSSAIMISYPTTDNYERILCEFGQSQTNKSLYEEYISNKEVVQNVVSYDSIKACFILHAHLDHIGMLPTLVNNHINIPVITTYENKKLIEPLLLDGSYIMNRNINSMLKQKYKVTPLYTESDVYMLMHNVIEKSMNETHKLNDYVSYKFIHSGHILGSCQLVLYIKTLSGNTKTIHITSDLGSEYNQAPFVKSKELLSVSNVSIFEATYNQLNRGFKNKKEVEKERVKLANIIKKELNKNKRILFGAFAQGRTQNLMIYLYEIFKEDPSFDTSIFIDGKLCHAITNAYMSILSDEDREYFKEVLSWDKFIYIDSYDKSLMTAINKDKKIIISGGGMFSQGRILNHLKTMIEDKDSVIITCGYCGEGTIGREIQRTDNKIIKIEGLEYIKKCKVYNMNTWSSHIMANENIEYMSKINTPLILIHHSDNNKYNFRDIIENTLRQKNNSAKVLCVDEENSIFFI